MAMVNKIVLIKPKSTYVSSMPRIPLSVLFIGSTLKHNGYEVRVIDANVERNYEQAIMKECKDADLVGISALTSEVKCGLEITKLIKEKSNSLIIWGGIHPSLFPQLTCEDSLIDLVGCGEGEPLLLEIAKGKPFNEIEGLVYKENGEVIINKTRPYIDLNTLPLMDYTLIDMSKYYEGGTWRKAVDVQTSRGCPNDCLFCVNKALGTHKMRFMSAERVVLECERLVNGYGANFITFTDDNFFLNRKRARDICNGILSHKLKFKWFAEVRADYFRDGFIDKEFLELAQESGLSNLTIGAESGVPKYLTMLGKGITTENIEQSAKTLSQTNITTAYSFLIGLPDETKEDIFTTLGFIEKLQKIYPNGVYGIGILRAYPKSELTDRFVNQGLIIEPKTLGEFADDKFNRVYIDILLRPVWHKHPDFVVKISRYSDIAYGVFLSSSVRKNLKYGSILLLPEKTLQKIARWRVHHKFFKFPIDLYIGESLHKLYTSSFVRKLAKWRK